MGRSIEVVTIIIGRFFSVSPTKFGFTLAKASRTVYVEVAGNRVMERNTDAIVFVVAVSNSSFYMTIGSRATDIPAFYPDWFISRLTSGWCAKRNPFSNRQEIIDFRNARFIVFWSKNPAPLIPYLSAIRATGIDFYFQYTLNDYPITIELNWEL